MTNLYHVLLGRILHCTTHAYFIEVPRVMTLKQTKPTPQRKVASHTIFFAFFAATEKTRDDDSKDAFPLIPVIIGIVAVLLILIVAILVFILYRYVQYLSERNYCAKDTTFHPSSS